MAQKITKDGIITDPDKVSVIVSRPSCNIKPQLSCIQIFSWYRMFIPNVVEMGRLLANLTKMNAVWKWGKGVRDAWEHLKISLTTNPVLKQVDSKEPYVIK